MDTHNPNPVPESLIHYWTMWNEADLEAVRGHLNQAVTENVEWVDPLHSFVGRDALEANVRSLRTEKPEYYFALASEFDIHHDRVRYRWDMMRKHRVLLEGLDVVTIDVSGLISRVEGFFGHPKPLGPASEIPDHLRPRPS